MVRGNSSRYVDVSVDPVTSHALWLHVTCPEPAPAAAHGDTSQRETADATSDAEPSSCDSTVEGTHDTVQQNPKVQV